MFDDHELIYYLCSFCRSFTRSLGAISRPEQTKAGHLDCLLIPVEAYQSYDLHTTFPEDSCLEGWLSSNVVCALKLTRLLNILIVLLFYVCS